MYTATFELEGISPYSPAGTLKAPKKKQESPGDYDDRCWRDRMVVDESGIVCIPQLAFKLALESAAMYGGKKIAGKGNATYSKHFCSGILALEPMPIRGAKATDVIGERVYVPSDGKRAILSRGSSKRVWRTFPMIPSPWHVTAVLSIVDEVVTRDILQETAIEAGRFVGLGRFRPQSGGFYGRFVVRKFSATKSD
jgi:hypothetical protein